MLLLLWKNIVAPIFNSAIGATLSSNIPKNTFNNSSVLKVLSRSGYLKTFNAGKSTRTFTGARSIDVFTRKL